MAVASRSRAGDPPAGRVALVTLGCARNEVDSEQLAATLTADGWRLVDSPDRADAVVVNTCGFVQAAKADSIEALLGAAGLREGPTPVKAVVAVGCLAERYGAELAAALPEADAVVGFDGYADLGSRLRATLAGSPPPAHAPRDRRRLLPVAPIERQPRVGSPPDVAPGIGPPSGPRVVRQRLGSGPVAPLKLASGCDRRCAFCAIPRFRGAFVSRPPDQVQAEAEWLAARGVRELLLVSENSTSYGKDLGDPRALERLLPALAAVPGIVRVRVAYLQPAEVRPGLLVVLATTPGVAAYADLSFQHASGPLLRRMRRFGDGERFLQLLADLRAIAPDAGARSNVILGFPGETKADVGALERFLTGARLDAVGVFGFSAEDGTEAATLPSKVPARTIARRVERITRLVEELTAQRAQERIGTEVEVLVEAVTAGGRRAEGRAAHQAPEVDGAVVLRLGPGERVARGDLVRAKVVASGGVDLTADVLAVLDAAPGEERRQHVDAAR